MRHYNLRFVYFFTPFWSPKTFFKGLFLKIQERFLIKSRLWWHSYSIKRNIVSFMLDNGLFVKPDWIDHFSVNLPCATASTAAVAHRAYLLSKGRQGWEIGESECVLLCLPYYTSPGSAFATSSAVRPPPRRHSPPTFLGSARSQRFWSLKAALLLLLPSTLSWDLWISITQAHFKFSIYSNEEQRFMYRID